jgi:hypothetical protein
MTRYSIPVWQMAKLALQGLGGDNQYVPLIDIVNRVREIWQDENVVHNTIRCQVRMRCVNGHPGHDEYPDVGKMWRKQPTFVSNRGGSYRLYQASKDQAIYEKALAEHGETILYMEQKIETDLSPAASKSSISEIMPRSSPLSDVILLLEKIGNVMGFNTQREWKIQMGRIDLVWLVNLQAALPQSKLTQIPVVAFELETSWRTRKHIKGDILNLEAINVPIGVLIQQTGSEDDPRQIEALIRNTREYIKNLGKTAIVIWTDADVIQLAERVGLIVGQE